MRPSSQMRLAEARVPGDMDNPSDPTSDCAVAFFVFGGTVEANVARWQANMLDESGVPAPLKREDLEIGGLAVTTVEMSGTYTDGMPGGVQTRRPNWMFRGAIIGTKPQLTFVRMTGPREAMAAAGGGWEALIGSMRSAPGGAR